MKCLVHFMKTNLGFSLLVWYHNWEEFYVPVLLNSCYLDEQPMCFVNPLNPNIKIQILISYPYTFSIEVVERIC